MVAAVAEESKNPKGHANSCAVCIFGTKQPHVVVTSPGLLEDSRAPPSGTRGFIGTALWEASRSCLCMYTHLCFSGRLIKGMHWCIGFSIFSMASKYGILLFGLVS